MGIYSEVIEHLQQVWDRKMGKIILALLLLDISVVGTVVIGINTGNLDPLMGLWRAAFVLGIFAGFLLLSAIVILALQKPRINEQPMPLPSSASTPNSDTPKRGNQWFGETGRLNQWATRVVFVWMLVICTGVYIWGGVFLWQTGIYPAIQQIAAKGIDWASPDSAMTILMPVLFGSFWILLPLMTYTEIMKSRSNRNEKRNTNRRRHL